jgi:hypothetical protein
MTASTKMLIGETGGDKPDRERDVVFGGSWRIGM